MNRPSRIPNRGVSGAFSDLDLAMKRICPSLLPKNSGASGASGACFGIPRVEINIYCFEDHIYIVFYRGNLGKRATRATRATPTVGGAA